MKHLVVVAVVVLGGCFSKSWVAGKDAGGGDGDDGAVDAPPVDPTAAPKIAAGGHHACMIDAATKMVCWGDNASSVATVVQPSSLVTKPGDPVSRGGWRREPVRARSGRRGYRSVTQSVSDPTFV
ncbi:hypothetical protein BH11MYX3_BH11MYX3_23130 [soil metagenome]